jgi:hypothetical protein
MATIKTNVITPVDTAYIEISRESSGGNGTGRQVTYTYRGSKDALRIASANWVVAGGKYQIIEKGPYSEATVTFSGTNFNTNNPTGATIVCGYEKEGICSISSKRRHCWWKRN